MTTNAAIVFFFRQFGDGIRFETAAARKAGDAVFDEVRAARNRDGRGPRGRELGLTASGL